MKLNFKILALIFTFYSSIAFADTVYFTPIESTGTSQEEADSIFELLKSAVTEKNDFELIDSSNNADIVLKAKAVKLGNSFVIAMAKYKDGKKKFGTKVKAQSMEEMDVVTQRLVRATLNEVSAQKDARVGDVTQDETTKGTLRKVAIRQWEFGFGPAFLENLNSEGDGIILQLGYLWGIDPHFDIRLESDLLVQTKESDVNFLQVFLGLNYFFTDSNFAPYITGDVGYGVASAHTDNNNTLIGSDDDASGFSYGIGAGVKFFRTSNVNMGLQARWTKMLEKTDRTELNPGLTSITLSVYF